MKADEVIQAVCRAYSMTYLGEVTPEQVCSRSKIREVVTCRQLAGYIMRIYGGAEYERIGQMLGGRDHATVMHGCRVVSLWKDTNALELKLLNDAVTLLGGPNKISEYGGISAGDTHSGSSTRSALRAARTRISKLTSDLDAAVAEVARLRAVISEALDVRPKKEKNGLSMRPKPEVIAPDLVTPVRWTPEQRAALRELRKKHIA